MTDDHLFSATDLHVELTARRPRRTLVRDVSFTVGHGQSVGLVGESGSGKSMTVKAAMRLLPRGATATGDLTFEGRNVAQFGRADLARYRSRDVGMIHQDPRAHTNPMRTIGAFLVEGVVSTGVCGKKDAIERAEELLSEMGIPDARRRMDQYPHELSGGLLQRVMIAAALMSEPKLIFADEPTTALDVTVQSDVVAIMTEQIRDRGLGMLFITHDLDLAAAVTDSLVVMYAGTVVETGSSELLYSDPRHPYTAALLASRPSATHVKRLISIPGRPAAAYEVETGCVFADRCPFAIDICRAERPALRAVDGRQVACHRAEEVADELVEAASA